MDDTLADESGIPFLSSAEDIPVHSTPIKGSKVPLPSTKNVLKQFLSHPERQEDFTDGESLQSIRHSDLHPNVKGHQKVYKGQGHENRWAREKNFVGFPENATDVYKKTPSSGIQDLSNVDNLRQKSRNTIDKGMPYERSRSPREDYRGQSSEYSDVFKKPKDVGTRKLFTLEDERRLIESYKPNEDIDGLMDRHMKQTSTKNDNVDTKNKNSNGFSNHIQKLKHSVSDNNVENKENGKCWMANKPTDYHYTSPNRVSEDKEIETRQQKGMKVDNRSRDDGKLRDQSSERKRFSINNSRNSSNHSASHSRTLSSSKQNTSLSELENTTLHKQRQEIQLLMGELKDRDRELSDMMSSHQQQLVAWQQDRDRLETLERKCAQYEEDLRMKSSQLRNAVNNLKALKSSEIEHKSEIEKFQSTIDRITTENNQYKEELSQLQDLNRSLHVNIKDLSTKVGRLEAREEELTTSLRLKEKDISSATGHMKELSERLQQLDLKCKEHQDKERDAQKDVQDWKHKYENSRDECNTLAAEMDHKRKEVVRLAEENKSARQQLNLIQKEAGMMERCKDELIDSMRVKQERTDTQLRNLRELYDRQVREVASLQLQLDNSKELIYRQQNSIDEQQLSGSYQGRLSQASEFSLERSSVSQRQSSRHKSSPTHSSRYREPDLTGSHQQTQSSGYQSQLYENQTANQAVPNNVELNYIDSANQKHSGGFYQSLNGERTTQTNRKENQSDYRMSEKSPEIPSVFSTQSVSNERVENSGVPSFDRGGAGEFVTQKSLSDPCKPSAKPCHTPPKSRSEQSLDSPVRKGGYVVEETTIEVYAEGIDTATQKSSTHLKLSEHTMNSVDRAGIGSSEHRESMKSESGKEFTEYRSNINNAKQNSTTSGSVNGAIDSDKEINLCDSVIGSTLKENLCNEEQANCYKEFERKYTFENKLCSFLEDLDDIDDSIWDEKPNKSANVSTGESSPASKLRKLLIESQQMIDSLEKSTESPRQIKVKDAVEPANTGMDVSER